MHGLWRQVPHLTTLFHQNMRRVHPWKLAQCARHGDWQNKCPETGLGIGGHRLKLGVNGVAKGIVACDFTTFGVTVCGSEERLFILDTFLFREPTLAAVRPRLTCWTLVWCVPQTSLKRLVR